MHPEVQQSKPGTCPKCGMALVRKKPKDKAPAKTNPLKKVDKKNTDGPKPPVKKEENKADQSETPVENPEVQNERIQKAGHKIESPGLKSNPKTVRYDLYVKDTTVNYSGKTKKAVAINGSIPAPTLTFTEGDTAEVHVHNMMHMETSIHWHGVFLPNKMDGVPYLTQMPIKPHSTYIYKFPVIQNGTYWYHSHTKLQEQSGMYGALIFNKVNEPKMPAIPVVLSDWTDMNPHEVERFLHTANDWFAIKKGTTQSYAEAIGKGYFNVKVKNEWKRMNAMDVSDVYYERFLSNGKPTIAYPKFKAGDKVKLRVVNGGASTYFWLTWSGGKITVVGNDGNDVEPVEVDRLIIATAETYDIIVTIPKDMQYEFLATAEDRTKSTSLWLGSGMKMPAKPLGKLKYFEGMKMMNGMMKMNGDMEPMGMEMSNQQMDMNNVMYPEITGADYGRSKAKPGKNKGMDMKGHEGHEMKEKEEKEKAMPRMDMQKKKANPKAKKTEMKGHDMSAMDTKSMPGMDMGADDADCVFQ